MAKLAYMMGAYRTWRAMSVIMLIVEIVILFLLVVFSFDYFDEDLRKRAMKWLRANVIVFVITIMSIVYLPSTRSMVEILVEEAQKLEISTKSEKELREYFNEIAGYEEKEKDKNETN